MINIVKLSNCCFPKLIFIKFITNTGTSINLPIFVNDWSEYSKISFNRDGDGHENATGEEDISEGIEEVGEEVVMNLG